MRKKNWLILGTLLLIVAVTLIVTRTSATDKKVPVSSPTCCKKSTGQCPGTEKKTGNDGLIIESLSRQFIHVSLFIH